jgi:hypothetical protein
MVSQPRTGTTIQIAVSGIELRAAGNIFVIAIGTYGHILFGTFISICLLGGCL